jgi:photosystem II stability/assembly factor-like uncharacterized protein
LLAALVLQAFGAVAADAQGTRLTSEHLRGFTFRSIGPAVTGGRIHDVEALPDDPSTIYLATASGGIWKSTNKGTTWTPIFEDQEVSTFGDLGIAPSNHDIIYAGTGEQNNRQSTSWGNGVYRSTDAGATWRHMGLEETRHIGEIIIDPTDPDVAYVAALGNLWAPSSERGVFKTTNGGRRWRKVLFVDDFTGVVDMVMDPTDPNTLYAATYQRLRRAWGFNGGGPGSGIYKTTDGGRNWTELTDGVPVGDKGRIGIAIAVTNPQVLVATIEHASESGVYRTEDGGESWAKVSDTNPRPMYYSHIYIDPTTDQRVYILATTFFKSEDGGHTFIPLPSRPTYDVGVHSDFHDLWIDPNNPEHFYLVGDAGLHESWDMGLTHIKINNIPIGQFYGIGVDMRDPYNIYGGMQDNHSWLGPNATRHWIGIINDDWRQIGFGDGMYQQVDPTSHRYAYVLAQNGNLIRFDAETGDSRSIRPVPPEGEPRYRFDWVTPSLLSRHDPSVLYLGGNRLFISRDRGETWERTDDLTRQIDRDSLELMGIRGDQVTLSRNDGTSSYGEITTIAESPLDANILWVGTDDGNVQVTHDGGRSWSEVSANVPDLPSGTYVSRVTASATAPGAAYTTFDAHRDGDFSPYVYRTTDFGTTWAPLVDDLPSGSVNVIVEHHANPNLLFLGTEHALFASVDGGRHWAKFSSNLPTTLYDDLIIHPRDNDLIVGTHGRSLWILDDLTPLVEWARAARADDAHLFSTTPATIFQYWKDTSYRGQAAFAGENPPYGALLTYYLPRSARNASIQIENSMGEAVREFDIPTEAGIHRVAWDLRYAPLAEDSSSQATTSLPHPVGERGPFISPGQYSVELLVNGQTVSQSLLVRGDPNMQLTAEQWRDREVFLVDLQNTRRQLADASRTITELRNRTRQEDAANVLQALQEQIRALRRNADGLASEFNGDGVRQGSLYGPTETQRERKSRLDRGVAEVLVELERAVGRTVK